MYAIITDGGRQYKVEEGQELKVDYRELRTGDELRFDHVLAVSAKDGLQLGTPAVSGVAVTAEVLGVELGEKLTIQKLRRRKNSRRRTGHRQMFTKVRVNKIEGVAGPEEGQQEAEIQPEREPQTQAETQPQTETPPETEPQPQPEPEASAPPEPGAQAESEEEQQGESRGG